jgi:hypothetical protein
LNSALVKQVKLKTGFIPRKGSCFIYFEYIIAAIYFKNRLNKAWDGERESAVPINNEDRNMVKQTILQALVTAPNQVQ